MISILLHCHGLGPRPKGINRLLQDKRNLSSHCISPDRLAKKLKGGTTLFFHCELNSVTSLPKSFLSVKLVAYLGNQSPTVYYWKGVFIKKTFWTGCANTVFRSWLSPSTHLFPRIRPWNRLGVWPSLARKPSPVTMEASTIPQAEFIQLYAHLCVTKCQWTQRLLKFMNTDKP